MSLTYAKNAVIKGFVGVPNQLAIFGQNNTFSDASTLTPQQQIDKIYTIANNCKDGSIMWADEKAFLPVSQSITTQAASTSDTAPMAAAPAPPLKKEEKNLGNALLIGAGVFILYKILS